MTDEDLLALATADDRVLVTFNVADFPGIVRRWAEEGRPHRGCAIVVGIDHGELGTIIRIITRAVTERPDPNEWRDYTCFLARGD